MVFKFCEICNKKTTHENVIKLGNNQANFRNNFFFKTKTSGYTNDNYCDHYYQFNFYVKPAHAKGAKNYIKLIHLSQGMTEILFFLCYLTDYLQLPPSKKPRYFTGNWIHALLFSGVE